MAHGQTTLRRGHPQLSAGLASSIGALLHAADISIFNGAAAEFPYEPRDSGEKIEHSLYKFAHDTSAEQGMVEAHPKPGFEHATITDLIMYVDEIAEGCKVVAFGSDVIVDGVKMFPYIMRDHGKPFVAMLRCDFGQVGPEFRALHIKQVTVRNS